MNGQRPMARCYLALLVVAVAALAQGCDRAVAPPAQAASGRGWEAANSPIEHFTYTGVVHDLEPLGDRIWAATPGGLVELDRGSGRPLKVHTTLDGLPDIQCNDLEAIGEVLWIAGRAGLVRFRPDSDDYRVVGEGAKELLAYQPERRVLWALGRQSATRVGLRSGKARTWPLEKWQEACVVDDEIWTVVRPELPTDGLVPRYDPLRIECFEPLSGEQRTFDPLSWSPGATATSSVRQAVLVPAGQSVWVYVPDPPGRAARRLVRIDRASGAVQAFGDPKAASSPVPRCPTGFGDDVWAAWDETSERGSTLATGGELRHFHGQTGEWESYPAISGSRHDAPTAIKQVGDDLWVATRGYDGMQEVITWWAMGVGRSKAPATKHLGLCRWQAERGDWEVYRIPAETHYSYVADFWITSTDLWLLASRDNPEEELYPGGGMWLASYPRSGGEVAWHLAARESRRSLDPSVFRPLEGVFVIDDVIWVCHKEHIRRFDPVGRALREVEWPCRLAQTGCRAVAVRRDDVRVGTERCAVLRLDPAGVRFGIDGRVKIGSAHAGLYKTETVRASDGTEREVRRAVGWGAAMPSAVTSLTFGSRGELWVTSGRALGPPPTYADRSWGHLPDDRPVWFSPGGLLRLEGQEATVPTFAPWTYARRSQTGQTRFQAPPRPRSSDIAAPDCYLPGEPGVACMLPQGSRLWVGTLSDGLYLLEGDEWHRLGPLGPQEAEHRWPKLECRPDDLILALAGTGDIVWGATYDHLYRFDVSARGWQAMGPDEFAPAAWQGRLQYDMACNASRCARNSFLIEIDGDIWMPGRMGEAEDGLYRLRAGARSVECVTTKFVPNCAVADGDCLWIGTEEGLVRFDTRRGEPTRLTEESGLASSPVVAVALEGDTLWAVSPDAVTRLTQAEFESRASSSRAGEARRRRAP